MAPPARSTWSTGGWWRRADHDEAAREAATLDDPSARFEKVAALLDLDLDELWDAANDVERRVLVDEMLAGFAVHPDRLQVQIHGAPALNVAVSQVGLKEPRDSNSSGVGGAICTPTPSGADAAERQGGDH